VSSGVPLRLVVRLPFPAEKMELFFFLCPPLATFLRSRLSFPFFVPDSNRRVPPFPFPVSPSFFFCRMVCFTLRHAPSSLFFRERVFGPFFQRGSPLFLPMRTREDCSLPPPFPPLSGLNTSPFFFFFLAEEVLRTRADPGRDTRRTFLFFFRKERALVFSLFPLQQGLSHLKTLLNLWKDSLSSFFVLLLRASPPLWAGVFFQGVAIFSKRAFSSFVNSSLLLVGDRKGFSFPCSPVRPVVI